MIWKNIKDPVYWYFCDHMCHSIYQNPERMPKAYVARFDCKVCTQVIKNWHTICCFRKLWKKDILILIYLMKKCVKISMAIIIMQSGLIATANLKIISVKLFWPYTDHNSQIIVYNLQVGLRQWVLSVHCLCLSNLFSITPRNIRPINLLKKKLKR